MKLISVVFLASLMTAAMGGPLAEHIASQFSLKCVHTLEFMFFNLEPLRKQGENAYYSHTREVDDNVLYQMNFNFCQTLSENWNCNGVNPTAVDFNIQGEFEDSCRQLSEDKGADRVVSIQKSEMEEDYVDIRHTSNIPCKGEENYGVTFEIFCDPEDTGEPKFIHYIHRSTECRNAYRTFHYSGCKVGDLNALWRFVESNSIIFGIVAIIVGLYNLILGRKFIKPTIGLITLITTVALIMFVFYVIFLPRDTARWVGWLILAISIVLGGIAGFFTSKLVRIGVIILGFWAGVGIGLLLNNLIFFRINHVSVLWVLMASFGLLFAILSFFWYNYIVIICTSILGSYFFIRGIALIAGGYPNEFTIYGNISAKTFEGMPATFWVYVASMIISCAIGIYVQIKLKKREKETPSDVYSRV